MRESARRKWKASMGFDGEAEARRAGLLWLGFGGGGGGVPFVSMKLQSHLAHRERRERSRWVIRARCLKAGGAGGEEEAVKVGDDHDRVGIDKEERGRRRRFGL